MIALFAATLVVCAPGYPGTAGEAQPAMDALARALAAEAKLPPSSLSAVYEETEAAGMRRLARMAAVNSVLTSLRRAANGEKVAVLLDGTQAAALEKLPFASSLEVVEMSPPMPVAIVATVRKRIDDRRWKTLQPAFQRLANNPAAAEALEGVRMSAFVLLDQATLARARKAFRSAK